MRKLTIILLLFILQSLSQYSHAQWFQLPNLPVGGQVYDMKFANANTGWITLVNPFNTIKTTDGGMTWTVQISGDNLWAGYMQFFDENTGVALGSNSEHETAILKTTNSGINWNSIYTNGSDKFQNFYFVNRDTGWACSFDGTLGAVFRTIDGGNTFTKIYTSSTNGLDKIFFLKEKYHNEYYGWTMAGRFLYKTTNSGFNWNAVPNDYLYATCGNTIRDIYFRDTLNFLMQGISCLVKSTNGGSNWVSIYDASTASSIGMGNKDIGWVAYSSSQYIFKSRNFYQTYGKQQIPFVTTRLFAVDTSVVYGIRDSSKVIKTTNGGGDIISSISTSNLNLSDYYLYQNYPNPFNPNTVISYQLTVAGFITLIIYDVKGNEVATLVNEKQNSGNYSVQFDGSLYPSGIYFYKLQADKFTQTKKMVLLK